MFNDHLSRIANYCIQKALIECKLNSPLGQIQFNRFGPLMFPNYSFYQQFKGFGPSMFLDSRFYPQFVNQQFNRF